MDQLTLFYSSDKEYASEILTTKNFEFETTGLL